MVRTSGIREKLRSSSLKELARDRAIKRPRIEEQKAESDDEEEEEARTKTRSGSNNLLSILPKPKNSSVFGPTVKLEKLLKMPERADESTLNSQIVDSSIERLTDDGMIEVDVSKVVGDMDNSYIKNLTVEKSKPNAVIVPKGKEKQKNQITYLAQLGKATELERKEQAAQSRLNKSVARSKYGW